MKKLWLAVIIMVALLSASVFGAEQVRCRTERIIEQLDLARIAAQDGDPAAARLHAQEAEKQWNENTAVLDIFVRHEEVDSISGVLQELLIYADLDQPKEFLSRCARLSHDIRHFQELEFPFAHNIL